MPKTIVIKGRELYDNATEKFINFKDTALVLEHSLISISKWEARWKKPFLKEGSMSTTEETLHYIECMTISPQNPDPILYKCLTAKDVEEIMEYINDPMTATWFSDDKKKKKKSREILTSEVIYWQMTAQNIPIEVCQKWHLNRLLTLIRVCSAKNDPEAEKKNKLTPQERMALNKSRIAKSKAAAAKRPPSVPHK